MSKINITFNNKNFSINPASLADATAKLEAHLRSMMDEPDAPEERLEGDGAEFYTLAPTALSFRSTAPLNELNEVQINGVTVDPANYTLTEGSTIVTFPIDYLKTLNVGSYEVAVASNSKTVKGGFSVKAPGLNEHGFYYNQPYANYMDYFTSDVVMFIREDSTMDIMVIAAEATETVPYTVSEGALTILSPSMGELHCTFSANGMEINNAELGATLSLGENTSYVSDEDYIYIYKEDLGGYEVNAIDKTKAEYGAIKTGINGIDTVKLADYFMFDLATEAFNTILAYAPKIPDTVTIIGRGAFMRCNNLKKITIPSSVQIIEEDAFYQAYVADVYIADADKWLQISFGDMPAHDHKYILDANGNEMTSLILSDTITIIPDSAFQDCENLTSVTIPANVTSIERQGFCRCNSLKSVTFAAGSQLATIGESAFQCCESLTSIIIPANVTSIGRQAFAFCTNLNNISYDGTVEQWNAITFNGNSGSVWNDGAPATHVHCSDGDVAL